MGHSRSASQKLATSLLDWCKNNRLFDDDVIARLTLTHEEIPHVTGTSRETVTRLLSGFQKNGLIPWEGCNLAFTDSAALENSVAN